MPSSRATRKRFTDIRHEFIPSPIHSFVIIFLHSACSAVPKPEQRKQTAGISKVLAQRLWNPGARKTMRAPNWAQAGQFNVMK